MARQNIDEDWKTDPRRRVLAKKLGCDRLADGMRVEINWLVLDHRGQPVPIKKFEFIDDHQAWIESGLAEIKGDMVHIAGANRYQEFFDKQKVNASKGGKAKAAKNKQVEDRPAQKKPKLPKAAQTRPDCPSFSISSSFSDSLSSSGSSTDSVNTPTVANLENPATPNPLHEGYHVQTAMAEFIALWEDRNKARFSDRHKLLGAIKSKVKSEGLPRTIQLIQAYFLMPDIWVAKQAWSVGGFTANVSEIARFADSNQFISRTQTVQAEKTSHFKEQLRRIEGGQL